MNKPKLILFISMSLDGYLATHDDDLSWLTDVPKEGEPGDYLIPEGEDFGYGDFTNRVDKYIVGRQTYDVVSGMCGGKFPPSEKYKCYVISRKEREPENGVTFYNGDIEELVTKLKNEGGKSIYCDGGGQIVSLLLEKDLIDEFIITVIPILLGGGKRLFVGETPRIKLRGLDSKYGNTANGAVQLHYKRVP